VEDREIFGADEIGQQLFALRQVLEDFAARAPAEDLMRLQRLTDMEDLLNG